MKLITINYLHITLWLTLAASPSIADTVSEFSQLQTRWAQINYQLEGRAQLDAFEQLVNDADVMTSSNLEAAELWIWSGIIKSTYAGAKGGLGALGLAKAAKTDLEQAMEIDAEALAGSAYTSLGTLYANVPGWPLGFGNDRTAEELLLKAIAVNPQGIDSNYFYGTFLIDQKRFGEAREYLLKAQQAPPRPDRPLADSGRQQEIASALLELAGKTENK